MREAKVSELKARLSAYLGKVRQGETVIVLDRKTPIAQLVPYAEIPRLQVVEAAEPPARLQEVRGIRLRKQVDVDRLLKESRDER